MLHQSLRRPFVVLGAGALALGLIVPLAPPVSAQVVSQSSIVSANPENFTPNVLDGKVNAFAQVGDTIVAAGSFTQVQASTGGPTLTRQNIVAFSATTGVISTSFVPTVSGEVYDLEPAGGGSVYLVGSFTTVNATASSRIARLDVSNGAKVALFTPGTINSTVKNVDLVGGRLLIGGSFSSVGGQGRGGLASLDPSTGAVTAFLNLPLSAPINGGGTQALKMAVTPNGNRLVVIGNFTFVNGQPRQQVAMIDLSEATATLAAWRTNFYTNTCNPVFDTYMRDVDFSPDSSYFVVTVTGAYGGPDSPCDVIARWETYSTSDNLSATWLDYTGGDTSYAVAITGSAVYVGGHMRWMNNPYAGDAVGPGAVPREGIAALDPVSGLPLSWNPGRARGVGVFDMLATSTGLWVGSDTDRIGGETHRKIAFFPLAGGTTPPAQVLGTVPNDVYLLGRSAGSASSDVFYRVNAGGPALQSADDGPDWLSDAAAAPYKFGASNAAGWGPVPTINASVPQVANDRAPAALFASESWGPDGGNEMAWNFPVESGTPITVRLYLSNRCDCTNVPGSRVFDVLVDGVTRLDDWDLVARYGDQVGAMESFDILSDGNVDIDFGHVTENPLINGIEIIRTGTGGGGGGGITAADDVQRRYLTEVGVGANEVLAGTAAWSLDRGAFLVDGTLYTGWADGTFSRRSFNGTTFGAPITVPMYGGSFGSEVSNLTGIVYAQGRIFYTLFGDDGLHWRWFSPQSHVVGATRFEAGGDVGALDPARVQGMFLSGTSLYVADRATGDLVRVTLEGTAVSGPAVQVDSSLDWTARGLFLWNGTPAPAPNVDPTAVATGDCPNQSLTCTFDSALSTDEPPGSIVSRSWSFEGGGTSTAIAPSHTFPGGGDFDATLTVTDDRGATDSVTITVTVDPPPNLPPTAAFTSSCNALACTFNGNVSTDSDGTIASYAWTVDGVTAGTAVTQAATFPAAGTYPVTLSVTDNEGETDEVTSNVTVTDAPPPSVAYRGSATANANLATVAVPTPTGTQAGDVLLLFVTSAKGTTPPTPSGWTLVVSQPDGTDMRTTLYRRVGTTGGLGSVSWTSVTKTNLTVLAYSGAAAAPSDFASAAKTAGTSTSYTTPVAPIDQSGSVVVSFWALRGSAATWTAPAGTLELADSSGAGAGTVSGLAADQIGAAAGTSTARTATASVSSAKATMWTVVLAPS